MISKFNEAIFILSSQVELSILAKGTIVLVFGLTLAWLFRNARASIRHIILAATFAALLSLPIIVVIMPEMTIEVPISYSENSISELSAVPPSKNLIPNIGNSSEQRNLDSGDWLPISLAKIVRFVWAVGVFLLFVSLLINLWQLWRLRRDGVPWLELHEYMKSLASECGIRRKVEVLLHEDIKTPFTCGIWRPVVLFPSDARQWSEDDLRRVLVHELEHVRRGDWFIQLVARTVYAIYWFHPLIWVVWRRLCLEAERACDDAVIQCSESIEYADQLLSLAQRLSKPSTPITLGMANRSDLSIRLSAILNGHQRRGRVGLWTITSIALAASFLVLAIAPIQAVRQSSITQASSSVKTKTKTNSPKENFIDNSENEISKNDYRRHNYYIRKRNNRTNKKRFRIKGYKPQTDGSSEIQNEKLQAESDFGKLQPEKQRTELEITRVEDIPKRQKTDAERQKRRAKKEDKRTEDINNRMKLDAKYRKKLAEKELKRQKADAEYRKQLAKMQAKKDETIARQAGIISK